ncbi:lipopolysaccharide biosynthesis protein [Candidatus Desantisbacteria bacterium]|nr:lipopolysaccharide biosynthesis protein [Candidatus Omnitrophota bacterium]MBI4778276.1 lipopolysaccharide biosynthesis protein [Candidatus Desantisbacteria bacterium]
MSNFKKNILSVYGVNIINGVLGILIVPLSLKLLGTEGYGLFSIYIVLASFVALADLGIGKNLQRLLASEHDPCIQRTHLQNTFGMYLMVSLFLIIVLPALVVIIPVYLFPIASKNLGNLRWIIFFAVFEYFIAIPVIMRQNLCIAKERFDCYSAFNFVSGMTRYILMFVGILVFASPVVVVGLVVSRRFLDFFIAKWLMGKMPKGVWHPKFVYYEFKSILRHSTGLSTGQVLQSTVIAIGSLLVNRFFGLEGLGKYRAAFDLSSKIWFFSNGMGLVVFPKFVKNISIRAKKEQFFYKIYQLMNISWAGFNLISIVGILSAPFLFKAMYIQDKKIVELFVILLLGICLNAHANLSYELLQAARKYKLVAYISTLSLMVMVVCFYGMQQDFGIYAIGWAWIISQGVYSMVSDIVALSVLNFPRRLIIGMLILKIAIFLVSIIMMAVYFDILPQEIKLLPVICTVIIFIYSLKALSLKLNIEEINAHV